MYHVNCAHTDVEVVGINGVPRLQCVVPWCHHDFGPVKDLIEKAAKYPWDSRHEDEVQRVNKGLLQELEEIREANNKLRQERDVERTNIGIREDEHRKLREDFNDAKKEVRNLTETVALERKDGTTVRHERDSAYDSRDYFKGLHLESLAISERIRKERDQAIELNTDYVLDIEHLKKEISELIEQKEMYRLAFQTTKAERDELKEDLKKQVMFDANEVEYLCKKLIDAVKGHNQATEEYARAVSEKRALITALREALGMGENFMCSVDYLVGCVKDLVERDKGRIHDKHAGMSGEVLVINKDNTWKWRKL